MTELETKTAQGLTLEALAAEINEEHRRCEEALREGLRHALRAGELLIEAKGRCAHGTWGAWLAANFEGSERTAQAYMKVAREMPQLDGAKAQRVADLSFRGALKELSTSAKDAGPAEDGEQREWQKRLAAAPRSEPEATYWYLQEVAKICQQMSEKWDRAAEVWSKDESAPELKETFVAAAESKTAYYGTSVGLMHMLIGETRWLVRINEKLGNDVERLREGFDWFEYACATATEKVREAGEDLRTFWNLDVGAV